MKRLSVLLMLYFTFIPILEAQDDAIILYESMSIDFGQRYAEDVALSPMRNLLAIHGFDDRIYIWDIQKNETVCELARDTHSELRMLSWSPNEQFVGAGYKNGLSVWQLSDCSPVYEDDSSPIIGLEFSPDSTHLAFSCTDCYEIALVDLHTGSILSTIHWLTSGCLNALTFSDNGQWLAISDYNSAQLWDLASDTVQFEVNHNGSTYMAFSPDSSMVAVSGLSPGVEIWDINQKRLLQTCTQRLVSTQIQWLDKSTLFGIFNHQFDVSDGLMNLGSALYSWNIPDCRLINTYQVTRDVSLPLALKDDEILVSYSDKYVRVENIETQKIVLRELDYTQPLQTHIVTDAEITAFDVNPLSEMVVVGSESGQLFVMALEDGRILASSVAEHKNIISRISSVTWLSESLILSIAVNGKIQLWDISIE